MPLFSSNVKIVKAKREQRASALTSAVKLSAENAAVPILRATVSEIVAHIEKGEWTASQVLEAYISRAAYAQEVTNCLTEVMFESARKRAAELDAEFSATNKLTGPLHGVPISIKDQFEIQGFDTTVGFSQWANKPATRNADLINHLLAAGAVLYVKTNIPQTMFAFECSNPVWGRTTNPYNLDYTCGGSSGGEGALLAMDGSAAGIGTDIGGSLRMPAAYCGIYSLKPAGGRVTYYGAKGPVPGYKGITTVAGPMGRCMKDLERLSRVLFGAPATDASIPPLPFKEDIKLPETLKVGYYTSDKYIKASPACARAVLTTVAALNAAGHECIEFELPTSTPTLVSNFLSITSADGFKTMLSHLGPDKKENAIWLVTTVANLPSFFRKFVGWVFESVLGDKIFADSGRATKPATVSEYWRFSHQKDQYVAEFNEVWKAQGFDAIIAPVQAVPQLPHGGCDNFSGLAAATMVYNVLDVPVGVLPVTRVDPATDNLTEKWWQEGDHGSKLLENGIFAGKKPIYNPEAAKGMPVAIQVVGKKWEEERLLSIMSVVDNLLGERGFGPGAWDAHSKSAN